ncbi:MAG TPA: hypothetical protein VGL05_04265 [Kribbella sp.]
MRSRRAKLRGWRRRRPRWLLRRAARPTNSPVFGEARTQMADALARLLAAGASAGLVRDDIAGATLLHALGGICALQVADGWQDEARQIVSVLFDGLRIR